MCFTIFSNEKTLFQTINKNALAAGLVSLAYNLVPRALFLGFKSEVGLLRYQIEKRGVDYLKILGIVSLI